MLVWHGFLFLPSFPVLESKQEHSFFLNVLLISCDTHLTQSFLLLINCYFPDFKQLALSSDKIATLQMPLLNLHLDVKENGEVKPYSIEMNKEELQNLINSLEAANKVF